MTKFIGIVTLFFVCFSCKQTHRETTVTESKAPNSKEYYQILLGENGALKDSLQDIIKMYLVEPRKDYIFCLIQKADSFYNPKLQLEYMPIMDINTMVYSPIDTIILINTPIFIYDALFSKLEAERQMKANTLMKHLNSLGIDTSFAKTIDKSSHRNQAAIEFDFMNRENISVRYGAYSVFMPPLAKTVKFINN